MLRAIFGTCTIALLTVAGCSQGPSTQPVDRSEPGIVLPRPDLSQSQAGPLTLAPQVIRDATGVDPRVEVVPFTGQIFTGNQANVKLPMLPASATTTMSVNTHVQRSDGTLSNGNVLFSQLPTRCSVTKGDTQVVLPVTVKPNLGAMKPPVRVIFEVKQGNRLVVRRLIEIREPAKK